MMRLYTIGYAGFPDIHTFIAKLTEYRIQVLIDVRSSPYSAYFTAYNKENLSFELKKAGIIYRNYATQFGARQENRNYYKNGRLDFDTFTKSEQFHEGFRKIYNNLDNYCFTLMCAEKDPITCHRAIMISRIFDENGVEVLHITPDELYPHSKLKMDLLDMYFSDRYQPSLFEESKNDSELLVEAYRLQNDKIGFRETEL